MHVDFGFICEGGEDPPFLGEPATRETLACPTVIWFPIIGPGLPAFNRADFSVHGSDASLHTEADRAGGGGRGWGFIRISDAVKIITKTV